MKEKEKDSRGAKWMCLFPTCESDLGIPELRRFSKLSWPSVSFVSKKKKTQLTRTLRVALAKPRGEREGAVAFSDNSLFWEKVSLPPNHSPWKSHTASTAVYPTSTYCWAGDRVHGCHSGGQTAYSEVTIPFLVCAPIPVKSTTQLHYTTQMYLIRTFHGNRSTDQNRCWYLSMFMRPSLAWRRCCLRAHAPASCL
jgi:hypothetical protein